MKMSNESVDNSNLQQSIVNKIAKTAIASQLDSAQKIDVSSNAKASGLIQGNVNSLKITGEKIIAVKDIQLEKIDISCEDLSLNLTQAVLGKISLEQPGNFKAKIIFTQSDCDRLLNSAYVKLLLQNITLQIAQESATFHIEDAQCCLEPDGEIALIATLVLHRQQQLKTARFKIAFQLAQNGTVIKFHGGEYLDSQTFDLDETVAIMSKINDLLYLRHFANADLSLDLTAIEVEAKQLTVLATAQVKQLPDSITQSIESVASTINSDY